MLFEEVLSFLDCVGVHTACIKTLLGHKLGITQALYTCTCTSVA